MHIVLDNPINIAQDNKYNIRGNPYHGLILLYRSYEYQMEGFIEHEP